MRPSGSKNGFNPMTWNGDPKFFAVLRDAAEQLLAMHDAAPRVVRYVASMQKWLITQAIVALHFERKHDETRPPLTAGSLIAKRRNNCAHDVTPISVAQPGNGMSLLRANSLPSSKARLTITAMPSSRASGNSVDAACGAATE